MLLGIPLSPCCQIRSVSFTALATVRGSGLRKVVFSIRNDEYAVERFRENHMVCTRTVAKRYRIVENETKVRAKIVLWSRDRG
jgi:hypothetical protein